MSWTIELLSDRTRQSLGRFLADRSDATLFYSHEWAEVLRASYGHDIRCWIAVSGSNVIGAFPVAVMRVPGLGCKYVASPYQMHSGMPLADEPRVRADLLAACCDAARADRAQFVEVRHFQPTDELTPFGFIASDSALVTTTVPLSNLALTQTEHGHRQRVRKAERLGVEIVRVDSLAELKQFRRMYLETGRAMGAPQSGWPYFSETFARMRDRLSVYLARYQNRVIAGFLVLGDTRAAFARCSAHSSPEALAVNAGHALWWRALQDAAAAGCPSFHCGVSWSGDTGLIKWKSGWGGVNQAVQVYVLPIRSRPSDGGAYFEGYGFAKAVWKRLPLPVVDLVGHQVTRWIA